MTPPPDAPTSGFRSLTTRLIVWTLVAVGAVYLATVVVSNGLARRMAIAAAEREAVNETEAAASHVEDVLHSIEERTLALGDALRPRPERETPTASSAGSWRATPTSSAGRSRGPRAPAPSTGRSITTGARTARAGSRPRTSPPRYRYWERDWFREALASGQPLGDRAATWTPGDGEAWMVTFAVPFGAAGAPAGVATADLRLVRLESVVNEIELGRKSRATATSSAGRSPGPRAPAGSAGRSTTTGARTTPAASSPRTSPPRPTATGSASGSGRPLASRKPLWTEPYRDTGGGGAWMVTFAVPFGPADGRPRRRRDRRRAARATGLDRRGDRAGPTRLRPPGVPLGPRRRGLEGRAGRSRGHRPAAGPARGPGVARADRAEGAGGGAGLRPGRARRAALPAHLPPAPARRLDPRRALSRGRAARRGVEAARRAGLARAGRPRPPGPRRGRPLPPAHAAARGRSRRARRRSPGATSTRRCRRSSRATRWGRSRARSTTCATR